MAISIQRSASELKVGGPSAFADLLESNIDDVISFNGRHQNYCVGIVDMVGSTQISSRLTKEQTCEYYGIFLNSMAVIAQKFGAQVVKNIGDCLLFYFPDTSNYDGSELHKALECGMTMIDCSDIINSKFL